MPEPRNSPSPVVSSAVYKEIFRSPSLVRRLFPKERVVSPYEILDYQATLFLEDPQGLRTTFRRFERVRFLGSGVSAILDHFWGDGVTITHYDHSAGVLEDWFRDAGRHHLVVDLGREYARGEDLTFTVARTAMAGFAEEREWVETTVDHPIRKLARAVVFPAARPCQMAVLEHEGRVERLPVQRSEGGRTLVRFDVDRPRPEMPYLVRWRW